MIKRINISVILPTRNAATTIVHALNSILTQNHDVKEIIIVDNKSSDSTIEVIKKWEKKSERKVKIIKNTTDKGVGTSYNTGVKHATSAYLIFMHSDSTLPSNYEITKLIAPFTLDNNVIATYSKVKVPLKLWEKYNFWMKCLFSRAAGKEVPGLNCKFDCIKKSAFLKINGFSGNNFVGKEIGAEDADLHQRLKKIGKVQLSKATVIHLHFLGPKYSVLSYIKNRKVNARSYGRFLRIYPSSIIKSRGALGLKPVLSIMPFLPNFLFTGLGILLLYSFLNSKKMYLSKSTLLNRNILLLPFVDIFLIYYETIWMIQAFTTKKDI